MDTFEAARLKHAKNLERKNRGSAPEVVFIEQPERPEPPKERSNAASVEVTVTLPDGEFSFTLVKPAVYQNANRAKLNKNEFLNRIREGLKPLLGEVKSL